MQVLGTVENDFSRLLCQLEQSARATTHLVRVTLNENHPVVTSKCSSKRNKVGSSSGDDVKASSSNGECDTNPVPHIRIYLNDGALKTSADVKTRKVNFAQPLSTIKIKSPTPLYGWEDWHQHQQIWSSDLDEDDDDNASIGHNKVYETASNQLGLGLTGSSANSTGEKSKKSKRKQRRRERLALDNMYNVITDYLEDPYGKCEMEVNEDDYEFISEIRLCGSEEIYRIRGGNAAGEMSNLESLQKLETDEVLSEMKKIYGEIGAERIIKMEKRIEDEFISFKQTL